jgi:phosphoglycerate dehydrogenase-like enzyme
VRIVVADRNLTPHRERFESQLPAGSTGVWHCETTRPDLAEADVFVGSTFTASMARSAAKLRLVHVAGAGTDGIEVGALPAGVLVANTFHHENSIAEYVVATSILLWRRILDQDRRLRLGVWASPVYDGALPQPNAISAARLGFVGFGHIGRSSWNVLRVLGCTGAAVTGRGSVEGEIGLRWAGGADRLDQLMAESDIVVVSAPLSERTRGMIGEAQLRALGPRGVLINVGRGPLVDEKALYTALSNRDIAGAAIDVWYDYPDTDGIGAPSELPFADLDNLVLTPHTSGITRQTFLSRVDDITANIGRLQRREPLVNVVAN